MLSEVDLNRKTPLNFSTIQRLQWQRSLVTSENYANISYLNNTLIVNRFSYGSK